MIGYDHTYRGPLTYDKYALNILQLHNEVKRLKNNIVDNGEIKNINLKELNTKFNTLFNNAIDNSLSEELFVMQQYLKGGN